MLHSGEAIECNSSVFDDKRLDKRMEKILTEIMEKPNTSISQTFATAYQAKACYRFWSNAKVTPEKILSHHINQTVSIAEQHEIILAIQDTTELDFSKHKATKGLGYLESAHQLGIKVHTSFAVSDSGLPLGLLWQRQWVRPPEQYGKRKHRKQKPTKDKESQRWLDCHNEVNNLLPERQTVIHITDREGDLYDLLSARRTDKQNLLLRFA
jgi:hypothetical protein